METNGTPRKLPEGMIPWKPGQSGNPSGRPQSLRSFIDTILKETDDLKEVAQCLVDEMRNAEDSRDRIAAGKVIIEYVLGKPKQSIELGVEGKITLEQLLTASYTDKKAAG